MKTAEQYAEMADQTGGAWEKSKIYALLSIAAAIKESVQEPELSQSEIEDIFAQGFRLARSSPKS